ncbi:hypothetical protein NDU88_008241 [Pleurodeles waltl]|uniref:Uncharacterized protein n=1 Tax=Pleurodeles waltl TaxID=8319 RepID=A0AAV7U5J0_PLEWA|nr:hypothetical protein NDU88_008241 [Pleurodeles waltl]
MQTAAFYYFETSQRLKQHLKNLHLPCLLTVLPADGAGFQALGRPFWEPLGPQEASEVTTAGPKVMTLRKEALFIELLPGHRPAAVSERFKELHLASAPGTVPTLSTHGLALCQPWARTASAAPTAWHCGNSEHPQPPEHPKPGTVPTLSTHILSLCQHLAPRAWDCAHSERPQPPEHS